MSCFVVFVPLVDNSSSEFGSEYSAVCPAVEIDTCSEDCATDDDCGDREMCCAGCGHTCRTPRDLPYYNIPLVCPPLLLSLASDSAACDLECRSDLECPGSKICCRNGCSSSCQNGMLPAEPCNIVRERLDTNIREKKDSDDEDETSQDEELLGRYIPSCMEEGWFNPVQTWENNVWCVNVETGRPIGNAYIASSDLSFYCPSELPLLVVSCVSTCGAVLHFKLLCLPLYRLHYCCWASQLCWTEIQFRL